MAARTRKLILSENWKERIRQGRILERLMSHVDGTLDLSNTQIKAADILLKKVIPDLARTELANPEGETFKVTKLTEEDVALLNRYIKKETK